MFDQRKKFAVLVVSSLLPITAAFAGPDWEEGAKDAGSTTSTAQTVAASSNAPTTRVRGTTSGTALVGAADLVDMYAVRTGSNPLEFKFDMGMTTGGEPFWSARLSIFKKVTVTCPAGAPLTYAKPIATVVKATATLPFPILDGSAFVIGTGGQKLGELLEANTDYFVAVSGSSNVPEGNREASCTLTEQYPLFNADLSNNFGIYPALYSNSELRKWSDPAGATTGVYSMATNGVYPLPASSCNAAYPIGGSPTTVPFNFQWAGPASSGNVPCADGYTVSHQFYFEWTAPCTGNGVVTTCGLTTSDTALEVFAMDACAPDACTAAAGTAIACNDQCGSGNSSEVTFPTTAGSRYLVRLTRLTLGGYTGSCSFTCTGTPASGDLNGDGIINSTDLAILLGQWGTNGG